MTIKSPWNRNYDSIVSALVSLLASSSRGLRYGSRQRLNSLRHELTVSQPLLSHQSALPEINRFRRLRTQRRSSRCEVIKLIVFVYHSFGSSSWLFSPERLEKPNQDNAKDKKMKISRRNSIFPYQSRARAPRVAPARARIRWFIGDDVFRVNRILATRKACNTWQPINLQKHFFSSPRLCFPSSKPHRLGKHRERVLFYFALSG